MPTIVPLSEEARIVEANAFMTYALRDFPRLRSDGVRVVERCELCIASPLFAEIEGGLCTLCRAVKENAPKRGKVKGKPDAAENALLDELLRENCRRGKQKYDALVMYSGGKDSTYLIHKLRTDYPDLRILAVTVDSGFASGTALENARKVGAKLEGTDCMVVRPRKDLFYNAFRHALTNPRPQSCYLTIDLLDGELTFDIGRTLAASLRIPLFIAGTSTAQLRLLHNLDWFERPREIMLAKRTHTTGGYDIRELTREDSLHYWWDGTAWPEDLVPRNILPFHAWDYDEDFVRSEVKRLGYIEEGHDNPLVTNNLLIPLMVCIDYARLGYCGFEPEFALLIREGRAVRDQWRNIFDAARHLATTGDFLPRSVEDVFRRLNLRREEVGLSHD